jgi:transcription elongation factor GreA
MAGATSIEQPYGMESAHAMRTRGRADATAPELVIGASEFAEYEEELGRLRAVRDRDLPDRFRRAREYVGADAAEEIAHIREDSAVINARIARLEGLLLTAIVLPDSRADGVATLGSTVEVEYERTGRRASYRLSGIAAGGDARSVSARSPVGRALMGGRTGDVVVVDLPSGRVESLRIVAISPPPAVDAA